MGGGVVVGPLGQANNNLLLNKCSLLTQQRLLKRVKRVVYQHSNNDC